MIIYIMLVTTCFYPKSALYRLWKWPNFFIWLLYYINWITDDVAAETFKS